MELGIIGLGKIGENIALQCMDKGIKVVGKDREPKTGLTEKGVKVVEEYSEFVSFLKKPRVIFLSLPAGPTIDNVLKELLPYLDKGDVIMDGGNSYYKDSIRREAEISKQGIHFVDCGTSGGVAGARCGACFMIGGKPEAIKICEPILKALAAEGGYLHTGTPGSGHFVKLVHNGIEFGMLQAIGEGFELLCRSDFDLDLPSVFHVWSNGSVIRGWLVELMEKGLRNFDSLGEVPDYVEDTGEVNWLVEEAIEKEIPVSIITQSVIELFRSRNKHSNSSRAVAVMRHSFGGHPLGKDEYVAKERKISRIDPI
ncbi:decarboxylating 6-phosphogluconate dehydrogenase [Methanosarcina hadiensis]|uniref:phosphogluconate dehydrogenase (NAD(+)-dependent, decarboxylating) n=1 Tax=Methanosarcina hadiensis TaxID=3078083 RepID=UPI0039777533